MIWNSISTTLEREFDKQPDYDEKYVNTKLKSYYGKINTYYYKKEPAKANSPCYCLAAIVLNSVCKIKNEDDK